MTAWGWRARRRRRGEAEAVGDHALLRRVQAEPARLELTLLLAVQPRHG
jgi:hypothetical protein